MRDLDISEVVERSGIPASALRFYEEKRLISSVGRKGLHRRFNASVLDRLALIALGRSAGFSLDEIGRMFAAEGQLRIDRRILIDKANELEKTIRSLTSMRDGLRHAAACSAPNHMECPTFRRLVGLAAAKTRRGRKSRVPTASIRKVK